MAGTAARRRGGGAALGTLGEGRFLPLFPPPRPPPARQSALPGAGRPPLMASSLGCVASRMAEVPPGPSSLLPPPAPAAPAAAELRCPFPAGAALACCSEDEEDDEEHEGGCRSPAGGEAATAAKARSCLRCPQLPQEQQQQLNGLIGPELRHLRAAATLKSKVLSAAEAAAPDGAPKVTATKGAEGHPGERPLHSVPNNARTALPGRPEAAAAAAAGAASDPATARNGLVEGNEQEEEEDEQVRLLSSSLTTGCSLSSSLGREAEPGEDRTIRYVRYESELQMPDIMRLITKDLSEPYSIYTYRYFIHNWPQLCFLVSGWNENRVSPAEIQATRGRECEGPVCGPGCILHFPSTLQRWGAKVRTFPGIPWNCVEGKSSWSGLTCDWCNSSYSVQSMFHRGVSYILFTLASNHV